MKVRVFNSKRYERERFEHELGDFPQLELDYVEPRLTPETVSLAEGFEAVCVFVHDQVDAEVLERLAGYGVRAVALRSAGYNNVDLQAARTHDIIVVRVPAYAPHGVAEFAAGLLLTLNRKYHRAYLRVRQGNFSLDGLMGFNLRGKTAGVVGTGKIGEAMVEILLGFGMEVLAFDPYPNPAVKKRGVPYLEIDELLRRSDIISLHCPLTADTERMIDAGALGRMKDGAILINTSRGELVDTPAIIEALKSGKLGGLGMDVYDEEEGIFFENLSETIIQDDALMRLTTFPNVIMTSHQAFFTEEAMQNIVRDTLGNLRDVAEGRECENALT